MNDVECEELSRFLLERAVNVPTKLVESMRYGDSILACCSLRRYSLRLVFDVP